jgi:hypothetical protein
LNGDFFRLISFSVEYAEVKGHICPVFEQKLLTTHRERHFGNAFE